MGISLRRLWVLFTLLFGLLSNSVLWAMEQKSLPDFEVVSLENAVIQSRQFSDQERWLLLYIRLECLPCMSLLTFLEKGESASFIQRVTIILDADPTRAKTFANQYPNLAYLRWYVDPQREAWNKLNIEGTPVVIGIQNATMMWSLNGLLPDDPTWKAIVLKWLR